VDRIKKKYLIGLGTSLYSLLPLAGGVIGSLALWTTDNGPLAVFSVITGLCTAFGVFCFRYVGGSQSTLERAKAEVAEEDAETARLAKKAREEELNELEQALEYRDTDPRPEDLLRHLRELFAMLESDETLFRGTDNYSRKSIIEGAQELFDACVNSLRITDKIQVQIKGTPKRSKNLLESLNAQREQVIASVQNDVKALETVIQNLREASSAGTETNGRRSEKAQQLLDRLEAAKGAREEMRKSGLGSYLDRQAQ